jgi:predicted RNA-binding protein with PIN domain
MELMIDTWNVLHQTGVLPPESAGIGIKGLAFLIRKSRWSGEKITFVCDGTPSDNCANGQNYRTVFTGSTRTADDEIMDRVATSSSSRETIVVTSDREIIRSIKSKGAQHIGSAEFLQILVDDNKTTKKKHVQRPSGLSSKLAKEWKQEFGIDDNTLRDLKDSSIPKIESNTDPQPEQVNPPQNKKKQNTKQDEPVLPKELLEEARRLLKG